MSSRQESLPEILGFEPGTTPEGAYDQFAEYDWRSAESFLEMAAVSGVFVNVPPRPVEKEEQADKSQQ